MTETVLLDFLNDYGTPSFMTFQILVGLSLKKNNTIELRLLMKASSMIYLKIISRNFDKNYQHWWGILTVRSTSIRVGELASFQLLSSFYISKCGDEKILWKKKKKNLPFSLSLSIWCAWKFLKLNIRLFNYLKE